MSTRDRDPAGRPTSARPRDRAGRPLPEGARGVEPISPDRELTPAEAVTEAQRLLDEGYPFFAHEVLEETWKAAPGPDRDAWKGVTQVCVGLTHLQRDNAAGAVALLRRGARGVADRVDDPPEGLDLAGIRAYALALADRVERTGAVPPAAEIPALRIS